MRLGPLGLLAALALATAGTGCGKTETARHSAGQTAETIPAVSEQGAVGLQTSNTTRLGGADAVSDAAAVARTVYPALTSATRPQAVVLVGAREWAAALTASAFAGAPLGAPLLYTEDGTLPEATSAALQALHPLGAKALGGAQVIQIGTSAALPEGLRSRTVPVAGEQPAAVAAALEHVLEVVRGGAPHQVIVLPAGAPHAGRGPLGREWCSDPVRHDRRRPGADRDDADAPRPTLHLCHRPLGGSRRHAGRAVALRPRDAHPRGLDAGRTEQPRGERDSRRALHRRHVRLGGQRTRPRPRVRERRAPVRRPRRRPALRQRRLRTAAAAGSPPRRAGRAEPLPRRHTARVRQRAPVCAGPRRVQSRLADRR